MGLIKMDVNVLIDRFSESGNFSDLEDLVSKIADKTVYFFVIDDGSYSTVRYNRYTQYTKSGFE